MPDAETAPADIELGEMAMSVVEDSQIASELTPTAGMVEHFSVAERAPGGKAVRAEVPRKVHTEWEPTSFRPDPVELPEEQARTVAPAPGRTPESR
jgi:hypothetical protein